MYETKIRDIDDLHDANLVWLWPGHHRHCNWHRNWPVV